MWSVWKADGVCWTRTFSCLFVHLSRLDSQTMIRSSHLTMYSSMYIWWKHCMFHCHTNIPHTARKDTNKSQKQKRTSLPPTAFDKFLSSARMYLLSWKYFHAYIEWATHRPLLSHSWCSTLRCALGSSHIYMASIMWLVQHSEVSHVFR